MRKFICLGVSLLVCLFLSSVGMAQTRTISGTVTNAEGKSLPGVTVTVRNTTKITMTGDNGDYSISSTAGETLVFSYVGFTTKTVLIGSSDIVNITLVPGAGNLDEVVVVGYGTQRKGDITGAVTNVNMKALGSRPIADLGRGLQGLVPGLSVRIPSGEVGSDPLIRIRGFIGSIAGSAEPLILVDNVEIPSIQMINPNDIESVTILKDAASSSIYGAKAAFGVILITTKKGSNTEGVSLSYSNNFSWQNPSKEIDIAGIDGLQYTLDAHKNMKSAGPAGGFWRLNDESMEKIKEWQQKYGSSVKYNDPVLYGRDWYFDGTDKYGVRIYDPVKTMVKENAFSQNHNISLNGRSKNTTYNASFGYFGQEGMMKPATNDDFQRYTAKLSVSTKVTDFITVRAGTLFSDRMKRYPNSTNSAGFGADPWLYLYRWSRLFPTGVLENGEEMRDPYWDTKNSKTAYLGQKYTNLNFGTTVNLSNNWTIDADYTFDSRKDDFKSALGAITARETWYSPSAWKDDAGNQIYVDATGKIVDTGGEPAYRFPLSNYVRKEDTYVYKSSRTDQRHTLNAFSTYKLNLADKNKFKFIVGTNLVANEWESHSSRISELFNSDEPEFNFAIGKEEAKAGANWDSQVGYFGRINYAFDNKYLLETNLRYDATSKFPAFMQWKWYPSFSAGWVLSNEEFMSGIKDVLTFAKFRASYGSIGDQSVNNKLYISTLSTGKINWLNSAGEQFFNLGTPVPVSEAIGWQNIATKNIGADFRFFKNKFGVVVDLFERETQDMIIAGQALPSSYGASAPQGNYGNLKTRGYEISFDFNHRFKNGLGINVTANLSDAVTDITKAADWNIPYENRIIDNTFTTGKRYGDIYGYVTDRLYQKDDFVYDANGNFLQTTIVWQGTSKTTNQLTGKNPVYQTNFEDGNQILLISPGDVKFVDVDGDGYITSGKGTFGDPGDRVVIGNMMPRYEYGMRIAIDYKSFDLAVIGQGVGKRAIWGDGQLAIPGYFAKEGAMPQAIAGDYWRENRTDAFYPRAWNLSGSNSGFVMRPQTKYLLNMAYFRIKNITLGYNVSPQLLDRIGLKQARVFVSLENFITFDKLRGLPIDPEAISGYSMLRSENYNLGRTGASNPTFKIASVGLNISL